MSPSIISFPTIFFISFILILISNPQNTIATPSLIQKACSNESINIDTELCLSVLQSVPSIVSAKDQFGLSVAILDAGISNSTNMRAYIENVLNQTNAKPQEKEAFQECKLSYDQVVDIFRGALREVRSRDFEGPTYDLLIASSDSIKSCERALTSQKIEDGIILRGIKIVPIFGISAFSMIDELRSPPPTYYHY